MNSFISVNPFSEEKITEIPFITNLELNQKLLQATEAYHYWKKLSIGKRGSFITVIANNLRDNFKKYAEVISIEMGKPLKEAEAEIKKCALVCDYYVNNSEAFLSNKILVSDASNSYILFETSGIVFGIMPWNFPFWQVFRYAIPALMAGNVTVLKHAPNVPQCAAIIEDIFSAAGFDCPVFQNLFIELDQIEQVIAHPRVQGVTLTGSESAGRAVAALAGKHLKKVVLELGGSDPFIIFDDANKSLAYKTAWKSRMMNTGQSCIAAKRILVHKDIYEDAIDVFKDSLHELVISNPLENLTTIGPLARKDLADNLNRQIADTKAAGAKFIDIPHGMNKGFFVNPTLFYDVSADMPVCREEIFGPVMTVIPFNSEEEAIQIANDTKLGLGASIWTENTERAIRLAEQIETGNTFINSMVKSDPRLPFGGAKDSGIGRELSHIGIREFANIKTVYIA